MPVQLLLSPSGAECGDVNIVVRDGAPANARPSVPKVLDAAYTATNEDFAGGGTVLINTTSGVNVTLPPVIANARPLLVVQLGSGVITLVSAAPIFVSDTPATSGQYTRLLVIPTVSGYVVLT